MRRVYSFPIQISIVSFKGMLVNKESTSYDTINWLTSWVLTSLQNEKEYVVTKSLMVTGLSKGIRNFKSSYVGVFYG